MEEIEELVLIETNEIESREKSPLLSQVQSIEDILYMDNRDLDKYLETAIKELPSGIYSVKKMRTRICFKNFPDYDWKDTSILRKIGVNLRFVLFEMIERGEAEVYGTDGAGKNIRYRLLTNEYLRVNHDIELH